MASSRKTSDAVPVLAGVAGPERAARARRWRRVGIGVLCLVVVGACLGAFGPRSSIARSDAGARPGLEVEHPRITRAGLDTGVTVTVDVGDNPASEVIVEVDPQMMDRLGIETVTPTPVEETGGPGTVRLAFARPASGPLTVTLFGRVPTQSKLRTLGYSVRASVGGQQTSVRARTWVLP